MGVLNLVRNVPRFFELFRQGEEVANPATWKSRTVATNAIVAVLATLLAIAKSFGVDLALDNDTTQTMAAGAVAGVTVLNAIVHVITSKRVGLSSDGSSGA
jgi:hypothetical protein